MEIEILQHYYTSIYYSLRRNGRKTKLLLIILSFPAVIYAYYDVNTRMKNFEWDYPHEYLYYLCAFLLVALVLIILSINTISFVNSQRINKNRNKFKKELFECIRKQIPEIKGYYYYKKIHPKYFYNSGLYSSTHTDYLGDDLFYGEYNRITFEICELHVFKIFKQVFDGFFIRIILNSSDFQTKSFEESSISNLISPNTFQNIKVKIKNNDIYMAVKRHGKFFEQNSLREIRDLADEIIVLSDIVKLTREIIDIRVKNNEAVILNTNLK